jgi:DNA-directed RNA polymerase specialized sigma subunit
MKRIKSAPANIAEMVNRKKLNSEKPINKLIIINTQQEKPCANIITPIKNKIVYSKTQKNYPEYLEKSDIKQELYISFFKALKNFKVEKNFKFSTFAWTVLNNDLKLLKNKNFKILKNEMRINSGSSTNEFEEISNSLENTRV